MLYSNPNKLEENETKKITNLERFDDLLWFMVPDMYISIVQRS